MEITSNPESFGRHLNPLRLARELWETRAVLVQFAGKEVLQRYRGSRLGVFWIFLQPIFLLAIYTIAFGVIMKPAWPESHRKGLGEVAMAVYCGLTAFGIFSECFGRAPTLLLENASYVKRALFPVEMLPMCVVLSATFHGIVNLAILTLLGWTFDGFYAPALLAPIVLLPLVLLSCGAALLLAAVGPIFRDLRQFVPPFLLAITFLTPMFYSPSHVPARLSWLVNGNPLAFAITNIRNLIMWHGNCDWIGWGLWTIVCAMFMLAAYAIFMRLRHEVTDLV